jgi:hypothetical protein
MLALTDSALAPLCHLRHGPRPDRRRALELLAASRDGCTETVMLAHGFTVAQMVDLVRAGLATATAERVVAGRRRTHDRGRADADHGGKAAGAGVMMRRWTK